ncbi:MAG: cell division protein FtsA [Alphaproteobacteria bacterium]
MNYSFGKSTTLAALDIGSSKVCCLIARFSRDRKFNIVGYGYNASKGIKNGVIVDLNLATKSVCDAVESAEQMANERIERLIVNVNSDKIKSLIKNSAIALNKNKPVSDVDTKKVIDKGINKVNFEGMELVHCMSTQYRLDSQETIKNPINIYGETLSVDILLGMVPYIVFRNINTVLEHSHLEMASSAFSPYASALACITEEEKEYGATVVDIGGGTTSIAIFKGGFPTYFASIPVGGVNITNDIAYGLTTSFAHAERLKTLHGCAFLTMEDKNEILNIYPVGQEDDSSIKQVAKEELINIIASRVEEIFEIVNKHLEANGLKDISSHRVILTGGTSQLSGISEVAQLILDKQIRLGVPKNVFSLPEMLKTPEFASCVGLLSFAVSYSEKKPIKAAPKISATGGLSGIFNWLKKNI